jgi:hypothetical protein
MQDDFPERTVVWATPGVVACQVKFTEDCPFGITTV